MKNLLKVLAFSTTRRIVPALLLFCVPFVIQAAELKDSLFKIKVVDEQTGRGIPLVEVKTIHNVRYYTDSNGLIALLEPGLMNQKVFLYISSTGYEFPKDGFGNAGRVVDMKPGGEVELKMRRLNIAERLYRITGEGIYRDTVLLGEKPPIQQPLSNGRVLGQDSVQTIPYRNKLYWFWGDTAWPKYPMGNFHTTGAISDLPGHGGLDPQNGVDLRYFVNEQGYVQPMCSPPGEGVVWMDGFVTINDPTGAERLLASYSRRRGLDGEFEKGLAVFDDKAEHFTKLLGIDLKERWRLPRGHAIRVHEAEGDFIYFGAPFPTVRVKAEWQHLTNSVDYEAFTCLAGARTNNAATANVWRDANSRLLYQWRRDAEPMDFERERKLITAGKISETEACFQTKDVESGKVVQLSLGMVAWNQYRKKWILIGTQQFGQQSVMGEVWLAESSQPTGPFKWARKIASHEKYSFYNPAYHPFFDQDNGRIIYFEGTYSTFLSGNENPTPRYDYNQIMYRLDLDDPRLKFPSEQAN